MKQSIRITERKRYTDRIEEIEGMISKNNYNKKSDEYIKLKKDLERCKTALNLAK